MKMQYECLECLYNPLKEITFIHNVVIENEAFRHEDTCKAGF